MSLLGQRLLTINHINFLVVSYPRAACAFTAAALGEELKDIPRNRMAYRFHVFPFPFRTSMAFVIVSVSFTM